MDAYIYQADIYCTKCAESMREKIVKDGDYGAGNDPHYQYLDSNYYPQGPYPNGGGEADTPQHCGSCGLFLKNLLTEDGENYVKDSWLEYLKGERGNESVIIQWADFYDVSRLSFGSK